MGLERVEGGRGGVRTARASEPWSASGWNIVAWRAPAALGRGSGSISTSHFAEVLASGRRVCIGGGVQPSHTYTIIGLVDTQSADQAYPYCLRS